MIEKTTAYKVGEQFFPTIEEAQEHELAELLIGDGSPSDGSNALCRHYRSEQGSGAGHPDDDAQQQAESSQG